VKERRLEQPSEISDFDLNIIRPEEINNITTSANCDRDQVDNNQNELQQKKRSLRMHAIKCKCGDILGINMNYCPGCGINIEVLLEALRQDFHRINFSSNPKR